MEEQKKRPGFTLEELKEIARNSTMTQEEAAELLSQHVRKYYGLDSPKKEPSENGRE